MNKYIFKYIMALTLTLGLNACDSLFDNELPKHDLVGENAIIDESSAENALRGVYSYLDDSQYNNGALNTHLIADNYIRLNFLTCRTPGDVEKSQILPMIYDETESRYSTDWKHIYTLINAANNTIYYTGLLSEDKFGANRKNEILAEARFLRAFANMTLLGKFGHFWNAGQNDPYGIILRMEPSKLSNNMQPRSDVDSCYRAIFNDLDFAIQNGPDFTNNYHSCRTTAKAFKANYLMIRGAEGDYAKALHLANEVLESDEFSMEEKYADIFSKRYTSSELMFTQYTKTPYELETNVSSLIYWFGSGYYVPKEYTDAGNLSQYYNVMDTVRLKNRFKATLDSITITSTAPNAKPEKRLAWIKHYSPTDEAIPMMYMRLAQVHLIKAEAMTYVEGYTVQDVCDELNILRNRAQEPQIEAAEFTDMESIREEVFKEYVRELGMENGDPFFVAVRTMKGGERILKQLNYFFTNDNQLCFPIPSTERDINPVEQNPY